MGFYLILGLSTNTFLIYYFYFRVEASTRICICELFILNVLFFISINAGQDFTKSVWKSVFRYSFLLFLVGLFLEASLRLRYNLKNFPSIKCSKTYKYLNIASIESYGPSFVHEEKIYKQSLLREAKKFGLIKSEDNGLSLITIVDGRRLTVNQPDEFQHSCFLLGGSTIFNAQVPNELTIASQMQKKFNSILSRLIVHNFGVSGATSVNRLNFMCQNLMIKPGDSVVLYFGVNDICFSGAMNVKNKLVDLNIYIVNVILDILRKNLQIFSGLKLLRKPQFWCATKKYLLKFVVPKVVEVNSLCKAKNITFLAVLQPSLFSTASSADEEWKELNKLPKSLKRTLEHGNSLLVKELKGYDFFVDGRNMFKDISDQVFCDWVHTTEKGNAIIGNLFINELAARK